MSPPGVTGLSHLFGLTLKGDQSNWALNHSRIGVTMEEPPVRCMSRTLSGHEQHLHFQATTLLISNMPIYLTQGT